MFRMGNQAMNRTDLLAAAKKLPTKDRVVLLREVWDSIEDSDEWPDPTMPEWLKQELDRRLEDDLAHPERARPWEEVKAELLARLTGPKA